MLFVTMRFSNCLPALPLIDLNLGYNTIHSLMIQESPKNTSSVPLADRVYKSVFDFFLSDLSEKDKKLIEESNLWNVLNSSSLEDFIFKFNDIFSSYYSRNQEMTFIKNLGIMLGKQLEQRFWKMFEVMTPKPVFEGNSLCYCGESIENKNEASKCLSCSKIYHKRCMFHPNLAENVSCPSCSIVALDPLSVVKRVLKYQVISEQKKKLNWEIDLQELKPKEYVELRSVRISPDPNQTNRVCWPDSCNIIIDGKVCMKLWPLPMDSGFQKRQDNAVEVLSTNEKTKIQVRLVKKYKRYQFKFTDCSHFIALVVVSRPSPRKIIEQSLLCLNHEITYSCSLRQRFMGSSHGDLILEKQKIGLICPISRERIKVPARGSGCRHLQCFDYQNFLKINESSRLFKCPIFRCSERCNKLIIDPIIYKLITKDTQNKIQQIEFEKRGLTVHKSNNNTTIIELSDEDDVEGEQENQPLSPNEQSQEAQEEEIIEKVEKKQEKQEKQSQTFQKMMEKRFILYSPQRVEQPDTIMLKNPPFQELLAVQPEPERNTQNIISMQQLKQIRKLQLQLPKMDHLNIRYSHQKQKYCVSCSIMEDDFRCNQECDSSEYQRLLVTHFKDKLCPEQPIPPIQIDLKELAQRTTQIINLHKIQMRDVQRSREQFNDSIVLDIYSRFYGNHYVID